MKAILSKLKSFLKNERVLLAAIWIIGLAIWLYRLGVNDLDDAESAEVLFSRESLSTIFFHNRWRDQSPLYFVFLHFWRILGETPLTTRLLNVSIQSLNVFLIYRLAGAFFKEKKVSLSAALLAAIAPVSLWSVRNGRMYPLLVTLSILSVLWVFSYLESRRIRYLVLMVVSLVLGIYNHFFGFVIAAMLLIYLLVVLLVESTSRYLQSKSWKAFRSCSAAFVVFVSVAVLSLFQLSRAYDLFTHPNLANAGDSIPGGLANFFYHVFRFGFVNSNWGIIDRYFPAFGNLHMLGIVFLCLLAVRTSPWRVQTLTFIWVVLSLIFLGLFAAKLDFRSRHFIYITPLVFALMARGGLGTILLKAPLWSQKIFNGLRIVVFIFCAAQSLWLIHNKLDEGWPEWSPLLRAISRVHRPDMSIYMPPNFAISIPVYSIEWNRLNPDLKKIKFTTAGTREDFFEKDKAGNSFVFLTHRRRADTELEWRRNYLKERAYGREDIDLSNVSAEIYSKTNLPVFFRTAPLDGADLEASLIQWMKEELAKKESPLRDGDVFQNALVARAYDDGSVKEYTFFLKRNDGKSGFWKGSDHWDSVFETIATSGLVRKKVIWAHPSNDTVLVIAFPKIRLDKYLHLVYGVSNSGTDYGDGASIDFEILIDGRKAGFFTCENTPGWKHVSLDSGTFAGRVADLALWIKSGEERARHFCFNYSTSYFVPPFRRVIPINEDVSEPFLKRSYEYQRLNAEFSHAEIVRWMEEKLGQRPQGDQERDKLAHAVVARLYEDGRVKESAAYVRRGPRKPGIWKLGSEDWESVRSGTYQSGGTGQEVIWAHPANKSVLAVGFPGVKVGKYMDFVYGIADSGLWKADAADVKADVYVDGNKIASLSCPNRGGWNKDLIDTHAFAGRKANIVVLITTVDEAARHFCFNFEPRE